MPVALALLTTLFVSVPMSALDVVGTSATYRWNPATGPVAGYNVYVSRDGAPFPQMPEQSTRADVRSVTIDGAIGETIAIRVTPFDAAGNEGPPSPVSESTTFVADTGSGGTSSQDPVAAASPTSPPLSITSASSGGGSSLVAEVGELEVDHRRVRVSFASQLRDPVVIVGPPTRRGTEPGVVRVSNVGPGGFDLRFEEWSYLDGAHEPERISYLAVERGEHLMPDGSLWRAGTFIAAGTGRWSAQTFSERMEATPALFLALQTASDPQPASVRARDVGPAGFSAALFHEEAAGGEHAFEQVGYLAIDSPTGSGRIDTQAGSLAYLERQISVDERFSPILSSAIMLEEERSANQELTHADELVDFLSVGGHVFAQAVSFRGTETIALRRREPEHAAPIEWGSVPNVNHESSIVPLSHVYTDPVVVVRNLSMNGTEPSIARVVDVDAASFAVRVQEWDYLDGPHSLERLFYMVAEAGSHSLAGLQMEAGTTLLGRYGPQSSQRLRFARSFAETPALFTGVMTSAGAPVTSRVAAVAPGGFDAMLYQEEGFAGVKPAETLGWVAIEPGETVTSDDRLVRLLRREIDHATRRVSFGAGFPGRFPVALGNAVSLNGSDPVALRHESMDSTGIALLLQEETSLDAEMQHAPEELDLFVAE